ncbi:uncharacterized protein LOC114521873 isoform X2 [Dendronephthya gigantea]|uniref:uncharacterized protein LOC114521873 isoform X2 n=1 Tax=Dendronephthya gigantea TaxID=151771 RepID=UPI001069B18C|nr:uncharacterized protein LOC114521873 isoform X2 [Dendronephthya gigantea]
MTWPGASKDKDVHGKVYRITFNCQYKRPGNSNGQITGCLMLKTTGTVRIDHPGLPEKSSSVFARSSEPTTEISSPSSSPSLPLSPSTAPTPSEFLSTQSFRTTSPWTIHSSSREILVIPSSTKDISPSITQWPLSPSSVKEEQVDLFTNIEHRDSVEAVISFSTFISNTVSPTSFSRNERQISGNDENTLVYVIVPIMVVVVVIVTFAVVRFTMIREKKKMTKKCESKSNIIMSDLNNGKNEKDELYTDLDRSAVNAESNYQALTLPGAVNKRQTITTNAYNKNMRQVQNANDCLYADADRVYSTIEPEITDDGKQGAKINQAFDVNENDHEYSILEQTEQGTITCPTSIQQDPSPSVHARTMDTAPIYVSFEDDKKNKITTAADYVTILSPEPCQLNGSLYADLSDQRGGGNQYESLVKRKK